MTNGKEHIDELLVKQIAEGLSAEQESILDEWISESAENALYAEEMRKVWQLANAAPVWKPNAEETQLAWKAVQQKISSKTKVFRLNPYWAAAASVALLISFWLFWPTSPDIQFVQTTDGSQTIELADGSEVIVMPHSTFSYPKEFEIEERNVELDGSAYFTVEGNEKRPFKINTGGSVVEVVGTQFRIDQALDSVFVEVQEGIVQVYRDTDENETERIQLMQGESGFVTADKLPEKITIEEQSELRKDWLFEATEIGIVLNQLQTYYGVDFVVDDEAFLACQLSARYTNASLSELLEMLELTYSVSIEYSADIITITGEGC